MFVGLELSFLKPETTWKHLQNMTTFAAMKRKI